MAFNLSRAQKIAAVGGVLIAATSGVFKLLDSYVVTKTEATVAPIRTRVDSHIANTAQQGDDLRQVKEDVAFIRGILEEQHRHGAARPNNQ